MPSLGPQQVTLCVSSRSLFLGKAEGLGGRGPDMMASPSLADCVAVGEWLNVSECVSSSVEQTR